jgi:AraC-like DNA-binding protein
MPGPVTEIQHEGQPGQWSLREASPGADLEGAVRGYWEVEGRLRPFAETILPHGCIELMVNLGPPHRVVGGASAGVWRRGWLSGLQEHGIHVESRRGTHLISARLSPIGAVELLGLPLMDSVKAPRTAAGRFAALEHFLNTYRRNVTVPDFVRAAARAIETQHGEVRVSTLHTRLGVSRKHLVVTFKRFIGVSLRGYAKVQRFAWTIEQLRSPKTVDWTRLAHEAGYSDQSHLVRDFRRVGGRAATALLSRLTPDGIALWEDIG